MRFKVANIENRTYRVGSWMFPVADKNNMQIFTKENTDNVDNTIIIEVINNLANKFKNGYCYDNIDMLVKACKERGVEVEFYSGWLFTDKDVTFPTHHAWGVYKGNVIDPSIRSSLFELAWSLDYSKFNWREESAKYFIEEEIIAKKELAKYCTKGKVLYKQIIYVGSKDNYCNAKMTFKKTLDELPHHPLHTMIGYKGRTKLQNAVEVAKSKLV